MILGHLSKLIADGDVGCEVLWMCPQEDCRGDIAHGVAHKASIADLCEAEYNITADDEVSKCQIYAAIRTSIPAVERRIAYLAALLVVGT